MDSLLFAGLGNPGAEYQKTRHNTGFLVINRFAERHGLVFDKKKSLIRF